MAARRRRSPSLRRCLGLLLRSGLLDNLSILKEYANNADRFWNEALQAM